MKKRIKIILLCLTLLGLIMLCGCHFNNQNLSIDNHAWEFSIVQNSNGETIYCNFENQDLYEDAKVLDLWSSMKDGVILISNNYTQETFSMNYKINQTNSDDCIYDIEYADDEKSINGLAVVSVTERESENDEYTLIISINGYSIYFNEIIE